jgi:hypothetical protein
MSAPRTRALIGGVALVGLAVTGCSQVAALAPVGGDRVTTVKVAANDLLLAQGVAIKVAPVCETGETEYDCTGSTMSGDTITVTAPLKGDLTMVLKVGDRTLHDGPVDPVIQKNAEAGS